MKASATAMEFQESPPRQVELEAKHWQSANQAHVSTLELNEAYTALVPLLSLANWAHSVSDLIPELAALETLPIESWIIEHMPVTDREVEEVEEVSEASRRAFFCKK